MKKLALTLIMGAFALASCSTDTHYDSLSTSVEIDIAKIVNDGNPISIYQRYQFDRDLADLSAITVNEAWISSPEIVNDDVAMKSPDLAILRNITLSLIEPQTSDSTLWMSLTQLRRTNEVARLIDFTIDDESDIREYFDSYQQLEIEYHITLEPSIVTMYWRNNCDFSEPCTLRIPISIMFKMAE